MPGIPVDAYESRWFMRQSHIKPEEVVMIHKDIDARYSVAIHWGTFPLADEPRDATPRRLKHALKKMGISNNNFFIMQHGETRNLEFLLP